MWDILLENGKKKVWFLVDSEQEIHFVWKQQCRFMVMKWTMKYLLLKQGLNFGVKMEKDEFIGKAALEGQRNPKIERNWS